jgi:hypothetical protein
MKEWTQIARKKETNKTRRKQVVLSVPLPSKENGKRPPRQPQHSTPTFFSSKEWSHPPSPTMNQPRPEKNHLSGNPVDGETGVEISGGITRPKSGIQSSLSRETRPQR